MKILPKRQASIFQNCFVKDPADRRQDRLDADRCADSALHPGLGCQAALPVDALQFSGEIGIAAAFGQMFFQLVMDNVAYGIVGQVHRIVEHV